MLCKRFTLAVTLTIAAAAAITTTSVHAQTSSSDLNWYDKITIGGDFRYRHEMVDQDDDTNEGSNHRNRMRARLNMNAKVNDSVKTVIQIASGTGDAVSTNQTFDDAYTKKGVYIDMAYAQWTANSSTEVYLGKVKNTLFIPGDSELLWDGDLTPEGGTVNWTHTPAEGGSIGAFVNLGTYWYDERDAESTTAGASHSDTHQYSAQAGMKWTHDDQTLTVGVAQHTFAPTKNEPAIRANGNTQTGTDYANDYQILEVFLAYNMNIVGKPFVIFGNMANNGGADDEESGYLAGFIFGKLKSEGDWSLSYNYRKVEADAVMGSLADSDFAAGETDNSGHRIQAKYQLAPAVSTGLTYLMSKRDESGDSNDYDRAQLDFSFVF